jgi:hypothetical protein
VTQFLFVHDLSKQALLRFIVAKQFLRPPACILLEVICSPEEYLIQVIIFIKRS